ncbi:MAG: ABC transporter transmembrane domain-containing protein [Halocynthiibacter sp.]
MTNTPPPDAYTSRRLIGRLWRGYLSRHKPWLALSIGLMIIEGGTLALLALLLEPMFDRIFVGGEADAIWWIGGMIFGLFTIRAISSLIKKTVLARIAQKSSTEMQVDLLRHLLTLDSRFFSKNPPGALIERVQGDTLAVQGVWSVIIQGVGRDFFSLIWLFAVALSIDWIWTLVAVVAAPALIFPTMALQRYIRRKTRHMREQASLRATRLDEVFHGIDPVKLNQMEAYQVGRFQTIVERIVRAEIRIAAGRATIPSLIDIVTGLGFFSVLLIGAKEIIAGDKTVGEFMSFFTAMSLTFQPLRNLWLSSPLRM